MHEGEDNQTIVVFFLNVSQLTDKQKLDRFLHLLLVMIPPWFTASFLGLNSDFGRDG